MGRHSAPDDEDGDLLVAEPVAEPDTDRPRPRPRHSADADAVQKPPSSALVRTDVIEPELVPRPAEPAPREVVDAEIVEDELRAPRPRTGPTPQLVATPQPAPLEAPAPEPTPAPAPAPEAATPEAPSPEAATEKKERPSRADVRLLRQSSSLRARCTAAVLLPFIVYTIVLLVMSRLDVFVYWVWIPAILAGVLFGAQLDGAAKRDKQPPPVTE